MLFYFFRTAIKENIIPFLRQSRRDCTSITSRRDEVGSEGKIERVSAKARHGRRVLRSLLLPVLPFADDDAVAGGQNTRQYEKYQQYGDKCTDGDGLQYGRNRGFVN